VSTSPVDARVEVRLTGFPLALHAQAVEHHEGLLREFRLVAYGAEQPHGAGHHFVPARLVDLVERLNSRYAGMGDAQEAQIDAARARGFESIDLVYRVPPSVAEASRELGVMLEEADEFCRRGDLLTMATPPQLVRFRRWYLNEFVRQAEGEPPCPWGEYERTRCGPTP
jgi:hypothetical protein